MFQTSNFNSGIRAMGFICWKLTYMFWKKFQNVIFLWYIRYIDESLNLKFNFKFNFRIYNWYIKACIDLNFDLERFLVHVHMICRCMYKSEILYNLIHDSYMRYMVTYLGHKIIFNMIHDWYMRYMISYVDLNFI